MMHLSRHPFAGFLAVGLLCLTSRAFCQQAPSEADQILGLWLTADSKARIEVYKNSEQYAGKIVWLKEPTKNGRPAVDDKNPDEKLRNRPILGMELMYGFVYDEDATWVDGQVYDPESGDEYSGKLRLVNDSTMALRGYVLIPLLGRTETWTRVKTGQSTENTTTR